jgi:hypothetical protein
VQIINQGHDGIFGELKPDAMCNDLWMCWATDPVQRPSMAEVDGMLVRMRKNEQ